MSLSTRLLVSSVVTCGVFLLSSCDRTAARIKEAINQKWPPVSSFDRRAQALASSENALGQLRPVAYLEIDRETLDQIPGVVDQQLAAGRAAHPNQQLPSVSHLKVSAQDEGLYVTCDFDLTVPDPAVQLRGNLDGQMTIVQQGNFLLPAVAFNRVTLRDLKWTQSPVDANVAVPAINSILRATINNLNGAIHLSQINLAFGPIGSFDPATLSAQGLKVTGTKIEIPTPTVAAVSYFASSDSLQIMADVRLPGEPTAPVSSSPNQAPKTQSEFDNEFREFSSHFESLRDQTFGHKARGTAAAVSRSFTANLLNVAIGSTALHLENAFPEQKQKFDADIRPYSAPHINCDLQQDTRDCRPPNTCTHPEDTRSCGHDINIGGWNIIKQHINDPACEIAKAAQNQIYLRNFDACNAAHDASNLACETAKATQNKLYEAQKLACEADKTRLQVIEQLTHIGHISGDFAASGTAVADVSNFGAGPSLDTVSMNTAVAGKATVVGNVKFDPDTAGHLACVVGWTKELSTTVSIQQQPLPIRGSVTSGANGTIVVNLKGAPITIQLDPPPVQAIFVAHPELVIDCTPTVGVAMPGLAYRALQQKDIPSEISGRYQINLPDTSFIIPLQPIAFKAGNEDVRLQPEFDEKAVWFTKH